MSTYRQAVGQSVEDTILVCATEKKRCIEWRYTEVREKDPASIKLMMQSEGIHAASLNLSFPSNGHLGDPLCDHGITATTKVTLASRSDVPSDAPFAKAKKTFASALEWMVRLREQKIAITTIVGAHCFRVAVQYELDDAETLKRATAFLCSESHNLLQARVQLAVGIGHVDDDFVIKTPERAVAIMDAVTKAQNDCGLGCSFHLDEAALTSRGLDLASVSAVTGNRMLYPIDDAAA